MYLFIVQQNKKSSENVMHLKTGNGVIWHIIPADYHILPSVVHYIMIHQDLFSAPLPVVVSIFNGLMFRCISKYLNILRLYIVMAN